MSVSEWLEAIVRDATSTLLRRATVRSSDEGTRCACKSVIHPPLAESLEPRQLLSVTAVQTINRTTPSGAETAAASLVYTVTFNQSVTGVDATDFKVATSGSVVAGSPVAVSGSGASYTVTVNGIHGGGNLRLDLIDNDSISGAGGVLGGAGANNGSFQGQSYDVLQTFPKVLSIAANGSTTTSATSVSWTVTFSTSVTGVDAADFVLVKSAGLNSSAPVVSGSGATYTVTASSITGTGSIGLNLMDNGTIKDTAGNPLQSNAPAAFQGQSTYTGGSRLYSVAVGDLNGDGKPDVVATNVNGDALDVLVNHGDGTFPTETSFSTGVYPVSVALADLNGDGKLDAVVANNSSGFSALSVLIGNGDGTFKAQQTYVTDVGEYCVAVGDVNGDGKPDIVVIASNSDTVDLLLGNGDGTFKPETTFSAGATPRSVALADINGDGKLDLVVANENDSDVSVFLGNGNGTFQAQKTFATQSGPRQVVVADVNGDNKPDLLVPGGTANNVSVLLGNGDGTFKPMTTFATGSIASSVSAADVNGDGKLDLVVANYSGASVSVLLGNRDGTFVNQATFAAGPGSYAAVNADVNGDGKPDVVAVNSNGSVSVLLGNGKGNFTGAVYTITAGTNLAAPTLVGPGNSTSPGPTLGTLTPTFTWDAVSGATGYNLYIRDITTNALFTYHPAAGTTSFAVPTALPAGDPFRWNMTTQNGSVEGPHSGNFYFQTQLSQLPAPAIIGPGSTTSPGTVISTLTPTFTWNAVSGATSYGLYVRDVTTNQLYTFKPAAGTTSFVMPSNMLIPGHAFRWNMTTFNGTLEGAHSSNLYFQTSSTLALPAPVVIGPGTTASPGPTISTTPTFTWNAVNGATGYALYIRDLTTNQLILYDPPAGSTSFTVPTALTSGHTFRWNMTAFNNSVESSHSGTLFFQT